MRRFQALLLALATLTLVPVGARAQDDPFVDDKPAPNVALKVGDRVVTLIGAMPRESKELIEPKPAFAPPGNQRNVFRVYRIQKLETSWAWIHSDQDGTAGWLPRSQMVPFEKALENLTNKILAAPMNPGVYINRALLWAAKDDLDLALADLTTAIKLDEGNATAFNNRGTLWRRKKDTDKAVADFTQAIELDPLYAAAYNNRGITWRFKDNDRAIEDFSKAIDIDPEYFIAYNNRGNAYRAKRELDRAIEDYTAAVKIQPRYALAFGNRGMTYRIKKDYDHAIDDYNQALKLDPKNAMSMNNLAWLWSVCPEEKYRNGGRAVEIATKACELSGWKLASHVDTLAAACAEAGDFESAVEWQQKAQPLFPDDESRARGKERLNLYKLNKPYREHEVPEPKHP